MIKLLLKLLPIILILCIIQSVHAKNICNDNCCFDTFFRENYQSLLENLCPNTEEKKFFNILFNAYSIKFQGLDYEYENICTSLAQNYNECTNEKEKYLKTLSTIAIDEYDSFLDDLSFETCGCENQENPVIKKNKRKYRKKLKRLISKYCK